MAFSLTDDGGVDIADVSLALAGAHLHGLDRHGDAVGHLLLQKTQGLLPDDFPGNFPLGLRRHHVLVVEGLTDRHQIEDVLHQLVHPVACAGTHRNDLVKDTQAGKLIDDGKNLGFFDLVDLVDHDDDRSFDFFQEFNDQLVLLGNLLARLDQPQDYIHFLKRSLCCFDHIGTQLCAALVYAGGIQKDDLPLLTGINGADPGARRLGLIGSDGNLLPDHAVHQGRFADVGPAYDRGETGFFEYRGGRLLLPGTRFRSPVCSRFRFLACCLFRFPVCCLSFLPACGLFIFLTGSSFCLFSRPLKQVFLYVFSHFHLHIEGMCTITFFYPRKIVFFIQCPLQSHELADRAEKVGVLTDLGVASDNTEAGIRHDRVKIICRRHRESWAGQEHSQLR